MSEPSIPPNSRDLKPLCLYDVLRLAERTNTYVERANGRLGPHSPVQFDVRLMPGPGAPPTPRDKAPKHPRRQRPKADPESYSPIEHTLYSLQTFGWTHPSTGHFLMVPNKEYQALQILETKAVAAVVLELMQQTIGWEGNGPGGRREWAPLSVRHFDRAGLLSRAQAERGINRALDKGYIERRRSGPRGYEYRLRWKGSN